MNLEQRGDDKSKFFKSLNHIFFLKATTQLPIGMKRTKSALVIAICLVLFLVVQDPSPLIHPNTSWSRCEQHLLSLHKVPTKYLYYHVLFIVFSPLL